LHNTYITGDYSGWQKVAGKAMPLKGGHSFLVAGQARPVHVEVNYPEKRKKTGRLFAETLPVVITHHP